MTYFFVRVLVIFIFSFSLGACNRNQTTDQKTSIQQIDFSPEIIVGKFDIDPSKELEKYFKKKRNGNCLLTKETDVDFDVKDYCFKVDKQREVEIRGERFLFLNMSGSKEDAAHVEFGFTQFFVWKINSSASDALTLHAKSNLVGAGGGYGYAPTVDLIKISDAGDLAWVVHSGFMSGGVGTGSIDLFVFNKGVLNPILVGLQYVSYDWNEGTDTSAILKTKRSTLSKKFHDIEALMPSGDTFVFEFDDSKGQYLIPKSYLNEF